MKKLEPISLSENKKVYWASDFHLGAPNHSSSRERENRIVQWMDEIRPDAAALFLVGDIFDFWFEYKHLVPKGFIRFQGKLAEFIDSGIPVYLFIGNHDMWMFDYFPKELGIIPIRENVEIDIEGKSFLIGHGDGIGPGDHFYKVLRAFFRNPFCQFLFSVLPNRLSFGIANTWSRGSRKSHGENDKKFHGEAENQIIFCREQQQKQKRDYYIFGHRHILKEYSLDSSSKFLNLGDWISFDSYAVFDGVDLHLRQYKLDNG